MDIQSRAQEIADRVVGSCDTLTEEEDHDLMHVEGLAEIFDDIAWSCEICGWWVETHETEDGVCEECREDDAR